MPVGVSKKCDDLFFFACIERAGDDPAAGAFDVRDQRRELVAIAASSENRESGRGEATGNRCTDEVAGADDGGSSVSFGHATGSCRTEGRAANYTPDLRCR